MKLLQLTVLMVFALINLCSGAALNSKTSALYDIDYSRLSQDLLYAARTDEGTTAYLDTLRRANLDDLNRQLQSDNEKLAFWLNVYNAFTQILLKRDPEKYQSRSSFFSDRQIEIGDEKLSLDMVEHDLLRRSKIKWGLGYLNKLFQSKFEKKFRVDNLDYRIHFALNCGAKSCPPIAFYEPENIDSQLDLAMSAYLSTEAEFDDKQNIVKLPAIMGWFRGDFGGKKNMLSLLKKLEVVPANSSPKIEFKEYDWTLFLNNYKS